MPRTTIVPTERAADAVPASAPWRVLVADSDPDTRALYQTALPLAGCEVVEASDGRDALTKALVQPPTLIISELRLPLVDGYALCEILRRDAATRSVPILIVTAEARPVEINRARKIADAVLTKPTLPETLLEEIQRLMLPSKDRRRTSAFITAHAADTSVPSGVRSAEHGRTVLVKAHSRFTTTTPSVAPALTCPTCDRPLTYESSHIGGVSDRRAEQWDYFTCSTCGAFQYRQRTRKLRRLHADDQQWVSTLRKSHS
jgi:CheY-like chemotaxis protein